MRSETYIVENNDKFNLAELIIETSYYFTDMFNFYCKKIMCLPSFMWVSVLCLWLLCTWVKFKKEKKKQLCWRHSVLNRSRI